MARTPPDGLAGGALPAGLSDTDARRRLQADGPNALPATSERGMLRLSATLLAEPVFLLLIAASAVYWLLGDPHEAFLLMAFVLVAMAIAISRQQRTERVLASLRGLASPRSLVVREGSIRRIPGREVVVGDVSILEEGGRIAADGRLIDAHDLLVDESLLTGESIPVDKAVGDAVYSGTMVAQGSALVEVRAIGSATEIGKIGKSLTQIAPTPSPLQREIAFLIKRFAALGLLLSLLVVILFGLTRGSWSEGLLAGITLAMSMLPEEFSVILMVFMALGAWRLAKSQVLTRHAPVIETLGAATVLCVDKTGTLTQNQMAVQCLLVDGQPIAVDQATASLSPAACALLESALLASDAAPVDAMEQALWHCAAFMQSGFAQRHQGWQLVHTYPRSSDILAVTQIWRQPGGTDAVVAVKGAPETVMRLCRLDAAEMATQLQHVQHMAAQGLRLLAVGCAPHPLPAGSKPVRSDLPEKVTDFRFKWLGLVAFADPLRPGVAAAVAQCRRAGLRVVMITGDYPVTAQAIALQAGLDAGRIITGAQVEQASEVQLQKMVTDAQVFARILPHQKLRLVQAFKARHDIVAMTGDGINDAPALKAAHIGISMGQRGTDVAREASSLVLLNDDFGALVEALRLGRRIVDNLRKALRYVVGVHVPIAGMALLPLLAGTPLVMTPALVMFLEMIINPASSLVFEGEHGEPNLMQRPPRKPGEHLFGLRNVAYALLQGSGLLAAAMATFFIGLISGWPHAQSRTAVFVVMVVGNLGMIIASRSDHASMVTLIARPNRAQWWVMGVTLLALIAVMMVPWLADVFGFAQLYWSQWHVVLRAALLALMWLELVKFLFAPREAVSSG